MTESPSQAPPQFSCIEWHYAWNDRDGDGTTIRLRFKFPRLGERTHVVSLDPDLEHRFRSLAYWGLERPPLVPSVEAFGGPKPRRAGFDHLFVNVFGPSSHPAPLTISYSVYRDRVNNDPIGEKHWREDEVDVEVAELVRFIQLEGREQAVRLLAQELEVSAGVAEEYLPPMVYIAHRHTKEGVQIALELANCLRQHGLTAWVDQRRFIGGSDIDEAMAKGMASSSSAMPIFTSDFDQGPTFRREWEMMQARREARPWFRVVPLRVGVPHSKIWVGSGNPFTFEISGADDPGRFVVFEEVHRALRGLPPRSGP